MNVCRLSLFLFTAVAVPVSLFSGQVSRFHDFAQIADGAGIKTILLISNDNSTAVTVNLLFLQDDGSELALEIEGITDSRFQFEVPARGSLKLTSSGLPAEFREGWARLEASLPVGAQVFFEIRQGDQLVTQAAVDSFSQLRSFKVFVDQEGSFGTAIAVGNTSSSGPVLLELTLLDRSGQVVAVEEITLPALGHLAGFVEEFFPDAGVAGGTLCVETSVPVSVVTLRTSGLVIGTLNPLLTTF